MNLIFLLNDPTGIEPVTFPMNIGTLTQMS